MHIQLNVEFKEAEELLAELFSQLPDDVMERYSERVARVRASLCHPSLRGDILCSFGCNSTDEPALTNEVNTNDDEFLFVEGTDGVKYYEYTLRYQHDGKNWCLNFFATSDRDAYAKVQSIKDSLVLEGKAAEKIPLNDESFAFSTALALESVHEELYSVPTEALIQYAKTIVYKVFHNLNNGFPMNLEDDPTHKD